MKAKKSLQKLTETKINKILSLERITESDIEHLSDFESNYLEEILSERLNDLKGEERDAFFNKIEPIVSDTTKNQLWEYNHIQITQTISSFVQEYGRMPTKTEIANKTGLSRQTVHKHIKEYSKHPQYLIQIEQFKFMSSKVLANVFNLALNGDMGAAKLYFNVIGFMDKGLNPNNTLIQNQNNYIQINGTVLSQETIKHLNPEQLNTIETILKAAIPQHQVLEIDRPEN